MTEWGQNSHAHTWPHPASCDLATDPWQSHQKELMLATCTHATTCAWCCGGGKTAACSLPRGTLGMRNRWVHSPATVSPRSGRSPWCRVPMHHCHSHTLCQGYGQPQEPWGLVTPSLPPVMGQGCPHSRCCCFGRDAGPIAGAYWRKWVDGPQGHCALQCPQSGRKGPVLPEKGC